MAFFSALFFSLFITAGLIPILKTAALRANMVDMPGWRKVHSRPVPRIGGIAIAIGAAVPGVIWTTGDPFVRAVLIGAGILVLSGLWDDLRGLDYRLKFAAQISAALIAVYGGDLRMRAIGDCLPAGCLLPAWAAVPLTVTLIVGGTNAINLSDGLDGLAGGISMLSFICIAWVAHQIGNPVILSLSLCVIGAIIGFLRFNTHPAVIFMGDAGSQLLGYLLVVLSLSLSQGAAPLNRLFWLLLIGFPILDTLTVMSERLANGVSPFLADKNHFHHKLMRLGLYHSEAVVLIYLLQTLFVTAAYLLRFDSEWLVLTWYSAFSGVILIGFGRIDRRGVSFKRPRMIDRLFAGHLTVMRERNWAIKLSFWSLESGACWMFMVSALIAGEIPLYFSLLCWVMAAAIGGIWLAAPRWKARILRAAVYLVSPLLLFMTQTVFPPWVPTQLAALYNFGFGLLVFVAVLTLKFTRRRSGFQATPTDFLILTIAVVVPNLPDIAGAVDHLNWLVVKIIIFLFSYEVLIGELRDKLGRLGMMTALTLTVIGFKGI